MGRVARVGVFLLLGFVAPRLAEAGIMVWTGIVEVPADQTTTIPIYMEGDQSFESLNLYVELGGGGDDPPIITGLDVIGPGTVFESNHFIPSVFQADARTWGAGVLTQAGTIDPSPGEVAVLAWLTVDATGAREGDFFPLIFGGILPEVVEEGFWTDFNGERFSIDSPGSGLVVASAVPEPGAFVMFGIGAAAVGLCYQRRRRCGS